MAFEASYHALLGHFLFDSLMAGMGGGNLSILVPVCQLLFAWIASWKEYVFAHFPISLVVVVVVLGLLAWEIDES